MMLFHEYSMGYYPESLSIYVLITFKIMLITNKDKKQKKINKKKNKIKYVIITNTHKPHSHSSLPHQICHVQVSE